MAGQLPFPTDAQIDLARVLAVRHEVSLPEGFEGDAVWTRNFLDSFAFDTNTEQDIYRRIRNIMQWCREVRAPEEMARKLDITPKQVDFIISVLHDSGYELAEVVEDLDEDPEDACYRHLETKELYY
jgi:hypothetical protein